MIVHGHKTAPEKWDIWWEYSHHLFTSQADLNYREKMITETDRKKDDCDECVSG